MANTFKSKASRAVGTSLTSVGSYTVAADTATTVIGLVLANIHANTAISASAGIHDGTNFTYLVKDAIIPVGGSLIVVGGNQKVVLEEDYSVRANCSIASSMDVVMSVLEIT